MSSIFISASLRFADKYSFVWIIWSIEQLTKGRLLEFKLANERKEKQIPEINFGDLENDFFLFLRNLGAGIQRALLMLLNISSSYLLLIQNSFMQQN